MTAETRRPIGGLGRGLAALIPQREQGLGSAELPISAIESNPYQPRSTFAPRALEELAASIAQHGVLQPIVVAESAGGYRLIAGERRLRAAVMAGLERIPAVIRPAEPDQQLALALIENIQRADLNPLEEGRAFRRLIDEFGLTQEEVGQRVGRSRPAVTNTLRLLDLAPAVQGAVEQEQISEGHARAIAGLAAAQRQEQVAALVIGRGLSVRQTEELVKRLREDEPTPLERRAPPEQRHSAELERLASGLRTALGTKVSVTSRRRGGRITIEYYTDEDLERIYERVTGASA